MSFQDFSLFSFETDHHPGVWSIYGKDKCSIQVVLILMGTLCGLEQKKKIYERSNTAVTVCEGYNVLDYIINA